MACGRWLARKMAAERAEAFKGNNNVWESRWRAHALVGTTVLAVLLIVIQSRYGVSEVERRARAVIENTNATILEGPSLGPFEVYTDGEVVVFRSDECSRVVFERRFYLHVYPKNIEILPESQRHVGYLNMDFNLSTHGALRRRLTAKTDACFAVISLPAYDLARVETGQFSGETTHWRAALFIGPGFH